MEADKKCLTCGRYMISRHYSRAGVDKKEYLCPACAGLSKTRAFEAMTHDTEVLLREFVSIVFGVYCKDLGLHEAVSTLGADAFAVSCIHTRDRVFVYKDVIHWANEDRTAIARAKAEKLGFNVQSVTYNGSSCLAITKKDKSPNSLEAFF